MPDKDLCFCAGNLLSGPGGAALVGMMQVFHACCPFVPYPLCSLHSTIKGTALQTTPITLIWPYSAEGVRLSSVSILLIAAL